MCGILNIVDKMQLNTTFGGPILATASSHFLGIDFTVISVARVIV